MKKKHLSLSVLLGLMTLSTLAFATTSNNIDAHKKFRGDQALEVDQSQWFRELRMENWTHVVPEQ
ncbi:fermentation/respiration switch protein, partial [Vibrio mediterranei]